MVHLDEIKKRLFSFDKNTFPAGKMVAAVAILGKTLWIGNNNYKSHPSMIKKFRNGSENSCCHAEVAAIAKVPRQSRHKVELYVVRFTRDGNVSMAKPCNLCQNFLKENKINLHNVYYSDWEWNGHWKRLKEIN